MNKRRMLFFSVVALAVAVGFAGWLWTGNRQLRQERDQRAARIDAMKRQGGAGAAGTALERDRARSGETPTQRTERELAEKFAEIRAMHVAAPLRRPTPRGSRSDVMFGELFGEPTYAAAVRVLLRLQSEVAYLPFLESLPSRDLVDKVMSLAFTERLADFEVAPVARQAGLDLEKDQKQIMQLANAMASKARDDLRALLGRSGYAEYRRFFAGNRDREAVAKIALRLSYSEQPLLAAQRTSLLTLLEESRAKNPSVEPSAAIYQVAEAALTPEQWAEVQRQGRESGVLKTN